MIFSLKKQSMSPIWHFLFKCHKRCKAIHTTHTPHSHTTHTHTWVYTHHTHHPHHTHTHTHTHSLPLLTLPESATTYFYSLFLGRQPILCGLDLVGRNQILVQCLSVQETLIKLSKHSPWSLSVSLMQGIATDCPPSTNPVKDGT